MAKYRVIAESGAFMPRSPDIVRLDLGGSDAARAYSVRAPICELLAQNTEVDVPDGFIPGPHLEPLDDPARAAMAQYWKDRPGATLDPTRTLPLGRDPMAARTLDGMVMDQLERMAAEAVSKPPGDPRLDALIEAVSKLAGVVGQVAAPAAPRGERVSDTTARKGG
jgi:hypothetical protein